MAPTGAGSAPPKKVWDLTVILCTIGFIVFGVVIQFSAFGVYNIATVPGPIGPDGRPETQRYGAWMIVAALAMFSEGSLLWQYPLSMWACQGCSSKSKDLSSGNAKVVAETNGGGETFENNTLDKAGKNKENKNGDTIVEEESLLLEANDANAVEKTLLQHKDGTKKKLHLKKASREAESSEEEEGLVQKDKLEIEDPADADDIEEVEESEKPRSPWSRALFMFMISGAFDFIGCIGTLTSSTAIDPNVNQMCRGTRIAFIGILGWVFLGKRLTRNQFIGMGFALVGIVALSLGCIVWPNPHKPPPTMTRGLAERMGLKKSAIGIILAIAGNFFGSIQFVIQAEFLQRQKHVPVILAVGMEGFTGFLCFAGLLLPVLFIFGQSGTRLVEDGANSVPQVAGPGISNTTDSPTTASLSANRINSSFLESQTVSASRSSACGTDGLLTEGSGRCPATGQRMEAYDHFPAIALQKRIFLQGWSQLLQSRSLQFAFFMYFAFNGVCCAAGSVIGKRLEAAGRSILECVRICVVWVVEIFVWYLLYGYDTMWHLKFDLTQQSFWTEKAAFLLMLTGVSFYFGVIPDKQAIAWAKEQAEREEEVERSAATPSKSPAKQKK
ncbi:unnamed protein product [Amoebophrya sp. A25]|nr:unnamed protein product [Amoebophrya sp. A25]|eukprot:GSA25T00020117001.1